MNTTQRQSEPLAPDASSNGHEANGRFAPGNGGGPGNPFARRVAALRQVMLDCVTDKDMEVIVGELVVQARNGKLAAIKLLFQYVLGKPAATVNPDTLDLQEVEQYSRAPQPAALQEIIGARMPADLACNLMRTVLPYVGRSQADLMAEMLLNPEPEAEEYDEEAVEPTTHPAPSPNGEFNADASRRKTAPQAAAGADRPAARGNGRTVPRPPVGG